MKKYTTIRNYAKLHHKQVGMTLIELTVVLLILIGLAGLLIPYVGSFVQKTHDSTNSSNINELNSAFGRYIVQKGKLPNNLETLTNSQASVATNTGGCAGSTAAAGSPFCGLLDSGVFAPYTPSLNALQLQSLAGMGMNLVHDNNPAAANKTFASGTDNANSLADFAYNPASTVAAGSFNFIKVDGLPAATVTVLQGQGYPVTTTASAVAPHATKGSTNAAAGDSTIESHLAIALGGHETDYDATCYDYIAMGVGDHASLINQTIAAAPVHFPENADKGPVDFYNHYMAIIRVDKSNATGCSATTDKAKFMGVAMNVPSYPGSHLFGGNTGLAYAYDNQKAE